MVIAAAVLLAAAVPAAASTFGHYQPRPTYHEQVATSFYLPMRDGTRLAVRILRPAVNGKAAPGRFPVVWHHSLNQVQDPIDGTGPQAGGFRAMPSLTDHGYVVAIVARRGNGQSFGVRRGYHDRNETQDAYELTEWLAAQPWSTGKVGLYGCSNTGDAAIQALTVRPPHLKAVFSGCFSWHKYDAMLRGGIFAQWGTGPQRTVAQDMAVQPVDGDENKVLLREAAAEHQLATPLADLWRSMPYRDSYAPSVQSRFWSEGSAASYQDAMKASNVAVYVVGGWRDEFRDQGLIAQANLPGARIVIGPWFHCQNDGFALVEEAHRFFDQQLKGIDTGLARQAPIHYFVNNAARGGEWRASNVWPLAGTQPTDWFLAGHTLGRQATRGDVRFTVRYDVDCAPRPGNVTVLQPCHSPGAGPSFTSAALVRDQEVTGNPVADLWVEADRDANLFLYLEDVAPDGTITQVTEGRLRASLRKTARPPWQLPGNYPWHRAYAEDVQPVVAGTPMRLQFDLLPTSWVFKAGHRMQVTVTGADYRERDRGGNAPPLVRILAGRDHASRVVLPLIPARG